MEECSTTFSTTTVMCPQPRIDSVQPNRGPTAGGTRVSISGTDLGASYSDILNVTLRLGGDTDNCTLSREDYVVGRRIVCDTLNVTSDGNYMLEVYILRESSTEVVRAPYSYEEPRVTGVDPAFGPKSGGIEVVISGGSLSIGNTENTIVKLGDSDCAIT